MGLQKKCSKAQAAKVDLINVGDKGRNTFSSLLVGSVTEDFLTMIGNTFMDCKIEI
jgi:hypothetical protein